MSDPFEQDLAAAFVSGGERIDLVEAVLLRARRSQQRRRVVMTIASLAGCAIAASAVTASGALNHLNLALAWADVSVWLSNPVAVGLAGAVLLAAAAGRTLLRDA